MTLAELIEINALVARTLRAQGEYQHTKESEDYWRYHELGKELKDGYGLELDREDCGGL